MITLDPAVEKQAREFADIRAEYVAARRDSKQPPVSNRQAHGTSADRSFTDEYKYHLLAEQGNQIDESDILVGSGVDLACVNILQGGFGLDPETGDPDVDAIIKEKWGTEDSEEGWINEKQKCDIRGQFDFNFNAFLALRGSIFRGDIFGLPTRGGQLQLVENYRCRTPRNISRSDRDKVVFGVEVDGNRKPLRYYFTKDDIPIDRAFLLNDAAAIEAYDRNGNPLVYHMFHPKRVTGTRGVTATAPIQRATGMHTEIQESRLEQQKALSKLLLVRSRDHGFEHPDGDTEPGVYTEPDPCRAGETIDLRDLGSLSMYTGYPGEKLDVMSGNVPTPSQIDHAMQVIQLIAVNLDMPLIMFLMDASETNFSGWRGAMDQARLKFIWRQRWLKDIWHKPIYQWKMRQWSDRRSPLVDERLADAFDTLGPSLFKHRWTFPTWPYINPGEDVQVDAREIREGLNSPRRVQKRHAREWPIVANEIVDDHSLIIRKAMDEAAALNQHPFIVANPEQKVGWRDLCNRSLPEGSQSNLTPIVPSTNAPEIANNGN